MLTVQVWDRGLVKAVDKAIREAGLGLNPQTEGQVIRVPIPELNEERRQRADQGRGEIRRAGAGRGAQRAPRRHGDSCRRLREGRRHLAGRAAQAADEVQKLTDDHIKRIDETLAQKDKEIMQV